MHTTEATEAFFAMTKLFQSNDVSISCTKTLDIHTLHIVVSQSESRTWWHSECIENVQCTRCNVWGASQFVNVECKCKHRVHSFSLWGHLFFSSCLIMFQNQYKWCHITNKFKLFYFFIVYKFWCLSNGSINISAHLSWICLISLTKVNYAQLLNYNYCW